MYEAIYHGISVVGIPLFVDQPDNIVRMKTKGAAVSLDFHMSMMVSLCFSFGYKENDMKLSRIPYDQPMKPLDRAVFWSWSCTTKVSASHELTWFQYHSLDL
ncbi:hypothetical protein HPG69_001451, partial [Diceros bicornis minor]